MVLPFLVRLCTSFWFYFAPHVFVFSPVSVCCSALWDPVPDLTDNFLACLLRCENVFGLLAFFLPPVVSIEVFDLKNNFTFCTFCVFLPLISFSAVIFPFFCVRYFLLFVSSFLGVPLSLSNNLRKLEHSENLNWMFLETAGNIVSQHSCLRKTLFQQDCGLSRDKDNRNNNNQTMIQTTVKDNQKKEKKEIKKKKHAHCHVFLVDLLIEGNERIIRRKKRKKNPPRLCLYALMCLCCLLSLGFAPSIMYTLHYWPSYMDDWAPKCSFYCGLSFLLFSSFFLSFLFFPLSSLLSLSLSLSNKDKQRIGRHKKKKSIYHLHFCYHRTQGHHPQQRHQLCALVSSRDRRHVWSAQTWLSCCLAAPKWLRTDRRRRIELSFQFLLIFCFLGLLSLFGCRFLVLAPSLNLLTVGLYKKIRH